MPNQEFLSHIAAQCGLRLLGITDLTPLNASEKPFQRWVERGCFAQMSYMGRESESFLRPRKLMPEALSCVSFGVFYCAGQSALCPAGYGRVARYAWGRDYHRLIKKRISDFQHKVEAALGRRINSRIIVDAAPVLERALAARAGLGFIGKNSMLIHPGKGSFFLLGEILWELECELGATPVKTACGSCIRCLEKCPTEAIEEAGLVNAGLCISYLTIEKRGALDPWERQALGSWVFGCDTCQEVCPHNFRALKRESPSDMKELDAGAGSGPLLDLSMVLGLRSEQDFARQFSGTPLMRAKREGLLRNSLCVAANTGAGKLQPLIVRCAAEDSSEIVRAHAVWALARLKECGEICQSMDIFRRSMRDPSGLVRKMALEALENGHGAEQG